MLETLNQVLDFEIFHINTFRFTIGNIITIIIILVISRVLAFLTSQFIHRALRSRDLIDKGREFALKKITKYFIYTFAVILAIESIGVNINVLIASSAALFVGIGLGLQNIFNDIVSGIFILFERTIEVDDVVEMEGLIGKVTLINIRTSRVKTRDGIIIIVPNSQLIGNKVINWSTTQVATRFFVKVGVAYGSDTRKVEKILLNVAKEHPRVEAQPAPLVRFSDFGNSSLDFELVFWTQEIWWVEIIKSDLRYAIDQAFRKEGITIPFPQRDLWIKQGGMPNPPKED
jgi:small-conductance mechanosensitive channel